MVVEDYQTKEYEYEIADITGISMERVHKILQDELQKNVVSMFVECRSITYQNQNVYAIFDCYVH